MQGSEFKVSGLQRLVLGFELWVGMGGLGLRPMVTDFGLRAEGIESSCLHRALCRCSFSYLFSSELHSFGHSGL